MMVALVIKVSIAGLLICHLDYRNPDKHNFANIYIYTFIYSIGVRRKKATISSFEVGFLLQELLKKKINFDGSVLTCFYRL